MEETEHGDPVTDVRTEQADPPIYLPGTPTVSFAESIGSFVDALRR